VPVKPHCGMGGAVAAGKNAEGWDRLRREVEGEIGTGPGGRPSGRGYGGLGRQAEVAQNALRHGRIFDGGDEAPGPHSARDELPNFAFDERWDAAAFFGGAQEGREVRADDLVQYRVLGSARTVGADTCGRTRRGHPPSCAECSLPVDPYEYLVVAGPRRFLGALSAAGRHGSGPACLGSAGGVTRAGQRPASGASSTPAS